MIMLLWLLGSVCLGLLLAAAVLVRDLIIAGRARPPARIAPRPAASAAGERGALDGGRLAG